MHHPHAEPHHRQRLQDHQKPDRGDQPAQGIVLQRPEQGPFHQQAQTTHKQQAYGNCDKERHVQVSIKRHNRISARHEQFAMGKVNNPHDPKNKHKSHSNERNVARSIHGIQAGLRQKVQHWIVSLFSRSAARGSAPRPRDCLPERSAALIPHLVIGLHVLHKKVAVLFVPRRNIAELLDCGFATFNRHNRPVTDKRVVDPKQLTVEFMLNALRLRSGVSDRLYREKLPYEP